MRQSEVFLHGEGDRYHERNRDKAINDSVVNAILSVGGCPSSILEIGCGDGRYLNELKHYYPDCRCVGIDPSADAIKEGKDKYPELQLYRAIAPNIWGMEQEFDIIIFGFCLYLIDRDDLFEVVYQADNELKHGGFLAIHDFDPEYPETVKYKHKDGLYSYKMDYPQLWLANPSYVKLSKTTTGVDTAITVLQKRGWQTL